MSRVAGVGGVCGFIWDDGGDGEKQLCVSGMAGTPIIRLI